MSLNGEHVVKRVEDIVPNAGIALMVWLAHIPETR